MSVRKQLMGRYREAERLISDLIGLEIESIGLRVFERAVAAVLGQDVSKADLFVRLQPGKPELDELIDLLVVPETWFFRDRGAFEYLKNRVERKRQESAGKLVYSVLSAPCSTGEEAFSIAATLIMAGVEPSDFTIDGLDISAKALSAARQAAYRTGSFREQRAVFPQSFFCESGDARQVSPEIVARVRFQTANLVDGAWPTGGRLYDAIFCKNLLIYLAAEARDRLIRNVSGLLKQDGLLFVGHSEVPLFHRAGYQAVGHPRSFALTAAPKNSLAEIDRQASVIPKPKRAHRVHLPAHEPGTNAGRTGSVRGSMSLADSSSALDRVSSLARARKLADQGQLEQAASLCDSLLAANCMDPEVYYLAGLIKQARDLAEEAEAFFLKASYLNPDHYESLVQLCLLSEQKGDSTRSSQYRDRMRRLQARHHGRTAAANV